MNTVQDHDHSTHTYVVDRGCQGCADRYVQWITSHPIVGKLVRNPTSTKVKKAWAKRSDAQVAKRVQAHQDLQEIMGGSGTAAAAMDFEGHCLRYEVQRREDKRRRELPANASVASTP